MNVKVPKLQNQFILITMSRALDGIRSNGRARKTVGELWSIHARDADL